MLSPGRTRSPGRPLTPGRTAVLLGLLFGLAGTSTSAVTVALPELATDLGVSPATAAWTVTAYTVALAVGTPLHGRLADLAGIRAPLCAGLAALVLGALAAALAPSFAVLVAARVLQGAGSAAVPVLATALLTARVPRPELGSVLGRVAGLAAVLSSLGPLAGGVLQELGGWRWAMALPVVGVLALPALWRTAPSEGSGERVDVVGALGVAVAATGLVLLIASPSAGVAAATAGAVLLAAGVPAVAARVHRHPDGFLPREIITNGTVLRSSFAAAAIPASWFALLLGVPLTAAAWGWSPIATGALLLPAAAVGLIAPRLAGAVLGRFGAHRGIALACPAAALALVLAALGAVAQSPVLLAVAVAVVTAAFGVGQPAMVASVGAAVPAARRGVALGVATLVFLLGAGVGAALVGGLAGIVGVSGAFLALIALPVLGVGTLLLGGPPRVATA